MTPYVLELVEKLRSGELSGAAFRVAQDAALEAGCRLRITNGRKVNIKKSNRPPRSLFGLDRHAYEWDSDRIFRELKREAMFVSDGYRIGRQLENPIVLTSVNPETSSITFCATTRQTPGMFVRRALKRAPDPRAKPSRVPERFTQRRLDGRRR